MNCEAVAALLLAGSAFFWSGWGRVAEGVTADGLDVGGMRFAEAEAAVRERFSPLPLTVHTPTGDFLVDSSEFAVLDDLGALLRRAKKGEALTVSRRRFWADEESVLTALCERNALPAKNAELRFSREGFTYLPGKEGRSCDLRALLFEVDRALAGGGTEVTLSTHPRAPAVTVETLKARTRLLSFRRTRFDGSNGPRVHNIALAASRIAGTVLLPGEEFSFNEKVGERTERNGFEVAAVISGGEFVPGVGGGVCQVSTTLYLAALEAGLTVTEARPHSLAVGYAPPSLDAMVSSASDLKFFNPYDEPVYLLAETGEDSVTFFVYGLPDGRKYAAESVVLARIPPPPPEETKDAPRAAKEGVVSESYLAVYGEDGELLSRKRLRLDRYAAVRGKIAKSEEEKPS